MEFNEKIEQIALMTHSPQDQGSPGTAGAGAGTRVSALMGLWHCSCASELLCGGDELYIP